MTKEELRTRLEAGKRLDTVFSLQPAVGDETKPRWLAYMGKTSTRAFIHGDDDDIVYIPNINRVTDYHEDFWLKLFNQKEPDPETINLIIDHCYTKGDFLQMFDGNLQIAYMLFVACNGQAPSKLLLVDTVWDEDDFYKIFGVSYSEFFRKESEED